MAAVAVLEVRWLLLSIEVVIALETKNDDGMMKA